MNYSANFLLIDDDRDDHEIFEEALKICSPTANCSYTFTCPEAIKLLINKDIPMPDYIFMDWNLPKLYGFACVEQIKQVVSKTTQLYILTGGTAITDPLLLNSELVNGILFKKASLDLFAKELASVIN